MNVKYWYEFKGLDEKPNRVEILCSSTTVAKEITGANNPFRIEYLDVKKLEPIQGSQASLRLLSKSVFQFTDLHTDDMQGYMVKFYRAGQLYWIGYLDSELYSENLTDSPPYPVEFSGADFNILERLKFRDEKEKAYTDINTLLTQLKRCFDKLGLPFQKLYIGCSTVPEGITSTSTETALHKLYIQSSNFYDEDGEPMSCREVMESILQPFGLMMVQRDASVYIYDLNTIKSGGVMKCYNFDSLAYVGDTAVDVMLGDISDIGTMSTNASLGFEEMINNTTITSSLYARDLISDGEVLEKNVSDLVSTEETDVLKTEVYSKCTAIEKIDKNDYVIYTNKDNDNTIVGARLLKSFTRVEPKFRKKTEELLIGSSKKNYILLKIDGYVNLRDNPFSDENAASPGSAEAFVIDGNLYTVDDKGRPLYYFDNNFRYINWVPCGADGSFEPGRFRLTFCNQTVKGNNVVNNWITNSNLSIFTSHNDTIETVREKDFGCGLMIPLTPQIFSSLVLEIGTRAYVFGRIEYLDKLILQYNAQLVVKNILFNNVEMNVVDGENDKLPTDDYEFKSYINKKVSSDYDEVTLKCISANEEMVPIGRANILKKVEDHYELQLSYTRSGQTNILERLLMSTIHSNFTTKNKVISVDIKMTENPALRYVTYKSVLQSDGMYITGATLDFHNAVTTIKAVEFSADVDKLSDIPYE